jgi:predicted amidohydrolase YtcJ
MKRYQFLFILIAVILFECSPKHETADLVIYGGKIYTMDSTRSIVEGVAVSGGVIKFAGNSDEAKQWITDKTQVIDLKGKTMTPGFIEGHGHLMGIGYNELNLNLMGVESFEEIVSRVKEAASKLSPGEWIVGRGWHQDKWTSKPEGMIKGFPTHQELSKVSPNNPVYLEHVSGHAALVNAKAMELAGVNQLSRENLSTVNTEGGEVIRDDMGNPTGLFNEDPAMILITKHIPEDSEERNRKALKLAIETCHKNGITGFHDAGEPRKIIELFKAFKKEDTLDLRLYVMITGFDRELVNEWLRHGPEIDPDNWLTIRSIKLNCDGALGSRGAWLLEPYTDRPEFYGMATYSLDTVLVTSQKALAAGFQVCSHAIGDRMNREILDRYELAIKGNPLKASDHRFRIEHAQHLHPNDIPRFGKLGVIPAMQAIHMSSDRPWAIERLGEKRIKEGAYMWQSLLKSGARIVNGTDAPVEPVNPIPCFYASVSRKTLKREPEGGYEPNERMTRDQALRSYTLDAAYGGFQEKALGSIEVGKLADFTIFSQDIMTVSEDQILNTVVETTIVDGKVVYTKATP